MMLLTTKGARVFELLRNRKDETNVTIAILSLALALLAFPITYFGYQLNETVEERNEIKWSIDKANYARDFWHDMEVNELDAIDRIQKLGKAVGEAQVAYLELMDEFGHLHSVGVSMNEIREDTKIKGLLMGFVGKVHAIRNEAYLASIKYDNSLLIYSGLAEVMGIKSWNEYALYKPQIKEWRSQLISPYKNVLVWIDHVLKSEQLEAGFENKLFSMSTNIGASIALTGNPTLLAIHELKSKNNKNTPVE